MMRRVSRAEDKSQIGKRHNIVHILKEVFIKKKLIKDGELVCNRKFCRLCLK